MSDSTAMNEDRETMNNKLTSLATGDTIANAHTVCLVELQEAFGTDKFHVLEITSAGLDKLADAPCAPEVLDGLRQALGDADALFVGYHGMPEDAEWTIKGSIRDRSGKLLPGLQVLAYDKDTGKKDDFLGCTFTDTEGKYSLAYHESDFKSARALIDLEGNPDLYLEVTDIVRGVTKKTETKGEAKQSEHFELKVDFDSKTKLLRAVVGYYFIEEDRLEDEIEELKDLIKTDADDAQAHFQLGLCFIEMMKADLRKSEWMVPEARHDDDILAVMAIKEFDEALALDPDRDEEAKKYRKYAQELQDLAL